MPEGLSEVQGDVFAGSVDIRIEGGFLLCRLRDWEAFDPHTGRNLSNSDFEFWVDLERSVSREGRDWNKPRYRASSEILAALDAGTIDPEDRRSFIYELHRRAAMAAAYFLFLGLGAPTGLLLRRGTQLGAMAIAAGYGIVYYVLTMRVGKELGLAESMPAWFGPWLTTAIGGAVSAVLLKRAIRR
jgi:lipopolysaccharide export LptBFGC system permease protein LptF